MLELTASERERDSSGERNLNRQFTIVLFSLLHLHCQLEAVKRILRSAKRKKVCQPTDLIWSDLRKPKNKPVLWNLCAAACGIQIPSECWYLKSWVLPNCLLYYFRNRIPITPQQTDIAACPRACGLVGPQSCRIFFKYSVKRAT